MIEITQRLIYWFYYSNFYKWRMNEKIKMNRKMIRYKIKSNSIQSQSR
jgi:hypothetical protein